MGISPLSKKELFQHNLAPIQYVFQVWLGNRDPCPVMKVGGNINEVTDGILEGEVLNTKNNKKKERVLSRVFKRLIGE
eukprot:scaffold5908_cov152-Skeletonema_marinoi.AAC.16